MGFKNWISGWVQSVTKVRSGKNKRARKRNRCKLELEHLEDRIVPQASPTLVTTPSPTNVSLPTTTPLTDSAVLSGGSNETGAITFTLTAPGGTVVVNNVVPVNGNGTYTSSGGNIGAQGDSLVQNGGFETPGNFTDWTVTPAAEGSDFFVGSAAAPHTGNFDAEFGASITPDSIAQTLATSPGKSYTLSYWLRNTHTGSQNDFQVSWGGIVVQHLSNASLVGWTNYTFTETATTSSTVLQLSAYDVSAFFILDDVSVIPYGYTPTVAGTYQWNASYSGDSNNSAVSDNNDPAEQVTAVAAAPTLTAYSPPAATVDVPYSYQFQATGNTPMTYTATNLPAWATLDPASGILTGTPTAAGTTDITVTASNGTAPDATQNVSLVAQYGPPTFTADTPPAANGGVHYSYQFQATDPLAQPISYTSADLPKGFQLNSTTGVFSGTPAVVGTFDFSVTASNGITPNTTVSVSLIVEGETATTFNVPANTTLSVPNDTYAGGTTFNISANAIVNISTGTFTGGAIFNVGPGAVVNIVDSPSFAGTLTGSGPGSVQVGDGRMYVGAGGVTLNFPGNMFQWTGGIIDLGNGSLTNLGTMTITAPVDFYNDGVLYNYGTIIQTGAGNLQLGTDGIFTSGLDNETGAFYLLEGNGGLSEIADFGTAAGQVSLINAGTIRKTAGTSTSYLNVLGSITSTGTIEADSGTIALEPTLGLAQISGSTLAGGTWNALNGASLIFPSGTDITTNQANVSIGGPGAEIVGLQDLASNDGSLTLTNGFHFTTVGNLENDGTVVMGPGGTLTVEGNFTQTVAGTYDEQIGGAPVNGQFGRMQALGTATFAGAFDLTLVNGFTAGVGQEFEAMMYASKSGAFTSANLGANFTESINPTNLYLNSTVVDPTNLSVSNVNAPIAATAGQQITVTWQVANTDPGNNAPGTWQDSVYLSTTPAITANSILLGAAHHVGGLLATDSYDGTLTVSVPALAAGSYYVIVEADSLYQVAQTSRTGAMAASGAGQLVLSLPSLTLNAPPTNGTFSAADQEKYYQVSVPAGGSLVVSLASMANAGALALYVGQGSLPTPYSYLEAADVANQPNQMAVVPQVASATTYYILVESIVGAAASAGFTIGASQTDAVNLSSLSASSGGNGGDVTFAIDGTNFARSTTASLTRGPTTITASSVYFQSASQVFATFNLAGAAIGTYALSVPGGANTETFNVVAASGGNPLNLVLTPPDLVRAGRDGVVYVTATNTSNNDILAPLLQLVADGAILELPTQSVFDGSTLNFLAISPTGPAGIVRPGESVQEQIEFQSTTSLPTINFQLNLSNDSQPMNWASQESDLQIPTIPNAAWPIVFANFEAAMGSTVANYRAVLAADATYLAQLGQPINDVLKLAEFEIEKANAAYTAQNLISITVDDLPAPGMDLTFKQTYLDSISGRYYQGILGGQGWSSNWDISATTTASGDVALQLSGSYFFFFMQSNGVYLPESGGQGDVLTKLNGADRLQELDGMVYQFNTDGSLNYVQDVSGNRITANYNGSRQLSQLTEGNGEFLRLSYNGQGQMVSLTDSNGVTETYGYTGAFLTSFTDANATTTYSYVTGGTAAQNGSLAEAAFADNTHIYFTYDAQGRLTDQHRDGGADDEQLSYLTPGGFVTTNGNGNSVTSYFNLYGATAETVDPLGNVTLYVYDANLNLVQVDAPGGAVYSYGYDGSGNVTSERNPLGYIAAFSYNSSHDLTGFTDASGNTTTYAYNGNNNLLSVSYANGSSQQYTYNPLGEATGFLNADGDAISNTYNANGEVTQETFADSTSFVYTYNARGNLTSATDAHGNVTTFVYADASNINLLTDVEYPDGTRLKFSYNVVGKRIQSADQSGFTVNYIYNAQGWLSELTDVNGNLIVQYRYDNAGNLIQKNNGNLTFTIYTFDADNRVLSIFNYGPSTGGTNFVPADSAVNSFDDYTYDGIGNVLTDTNQDGQWVYTYDAAGELTGAVFTPNGSDPDGLSAQNLQYVYDATGNRISATVNGVATTYVANNINEYTSSTTAGLGTTTYLYDAAGNLISMTDPSSTTTTYSYSELSQLTGMSGPGLAASYAYNPMGQKVSQTVNGATTNYQIDPAGLGNVVAAFSGSGAYENSGLIADFSYGLSLVSQVPASGAASYYDFDITGNTVGISGLAGTYVNSYTYLPFGAIATSAIVTPSPSSQPLLFQPFTFVGAAGVMDNGSGLSDMRARVYSSVTGQFLSNDPSGLAGGDANIRRYAKNDPVTIADPTGLSWCWYGPFGLDPHVEGGPNNFFGLTLGQSTGFSNGLFIGAAAGVSAGATVGFGASAGVGPSLFIGPSVEAGANAGVASIGGAGAGVGLHIGAGVGGSVDALQGSLNLAAYGNSAGLGFGFTNGSTNGYIYGYGDCPCQCPPNKPPAPPTRSGPSGGTPNRGPLDPNALIGPAGFGTPNYILDAGNFSYTALFENDGSAAAQDVTVTEQLDANLNWSTFQLGSCGFGPINVFIPAGLTHYQTTISYFNSGGTALNVQVALNFSVSTGLLTATFVSIDPTTGQAPAGVFDGFLYPENGTGVGEGYVQYTVQPSALLSTGTTINQGGNQGTGLPYANVVFDTNAPLYTNEAINTIDATVPTSSVNALPPTEPASFIVSWSGSDAGGSGVAAFNVYDAVNGGAFALWQSETSALSAVFTGTVGNTYSFYSVATNDVGTIQPTPLSAQASTLVNSGTTQGIPNQVIVNQPTIVSAGNTFTVVAQVEDSFGNVVSTYDGSVTIALVTNPGGSTLGGTLTTTATGGVATFSGLTLNNTGIGYTFQLQAAVSGGTLTATTLPFAVSPAAATPFTQNITTPLSATDANGNTLTYTALVGGSGAMFAVAQQFDLQETAGVTNFFYNTRGAQEKYLVSRNGSNAAQGSYYVLLPNGNLYAWDNKSLTTSEAAGPVATLPTYVYSDPTQLTLIAVEQQLDLMETPGITTYFYNARGGQEKYLVSGNGSNPAQGGYYILLPNGNLYAWDNKSLVSSEAANPVSILPNDVYVDPNQLIDVAPYMAAAYNAQQNLDLQAPAANYFENTRNAQEKYLLSGSGSNASGGGYYVFMPTGNLYPWAGSLASSLAETPAATLPLYYYQNPALLFGAVPPGSPAAALTVNVSGGSLIVSNNGFVGSAVVYVSATSSIETTVEDFVATFSDPTPPTLIVSAANGTGTDTNATTVPNATPAMATLTPSTGSTYSAVQIGRYDPLAGAEQLDLMETPGVTDYFYNTRSSQEKYLVSGNGSNAAHGSYYVLLPNGNLYAWDNNSLTTSEAAGPVALLDTAVYADPSELTGASPPYTPAVYNAEQSLDLQAPQGASNYLYNSRNVGEKYLFSGNGSNAANGGYYVLMPNGNLYAWVDNSLSISLANAPAAMLRAEGAVQDPSFLINAAAPGNLMVVTQSSLSLQTSDISATISGNTLTVTDTSGYLGTVLVYVSITDGATTTTETFQVTFA